MNERKRRGDRRSRTRRENNSITAAMAQTYLYKVKKEEPEKREKKKSCTVRQVQNTQVAWLHLGDQSQAS